MLLPQAGAHSMNRAESSTAAPQPIGRPFLGGYLLAKPLLASSIKSLPFLTRGKVRDMYAVDDKHLLIVTSDRLSAFDVVLDDPIPGKGQVLNAMANFWFAKLGHIIPNHLTGIAPESVVKGPDEMAQVRGRSVVAKRLKPLPIEAVVRGYLIGSGWKDYQKTGGVCGISLPLGLKQADKLPEIIFTPSSKADAGEHDENISFSEVEAKVGPALARQVREVSIQLYREAADYARERGIIIADTKFEFGLDEDGKLVLIDEVLTADSSRFWPADQYRPDSSPPSYDKQFVRDYLETLSWNKKPPPPRLPADVIEKTADKYREALKRLTGKDLEDN
jgi:phosphoribosylaminoimidazole-succinocarboxamide synthase